MSHAETQEAHQTRESILQFFPRQVSTRHSVESLASSLSGFIYAADLPARLSAFVAIREWTAAHEPSPAGGGSTRLEAFLNLIEARSELRTGFQSGVREIVTQIRSVELFAEAGLHPRERLWSEAMRRVIERVLPSVREDNDLSKFAFRLYPTQEAITRLVTLPDETFERTVRLLFPLDDKSAWLRQQNDLTQAFSLLAVHVAGIGLSPGLRARSREGAIEESPFYQLQQSTGELVRRDGATTLEQWQMHVERCRKEMDYVHQRMEETGVSTGLIFDMGTIERAITRMETIAEVLFVAQSHQRILAIKRLLDDVMNALREDMSLRGLFEENAALLARKVVERTGKTGEHYIADTPRDYLGIWKASLGGGLLTVLTAAVKLRIFEAHLPPFVDAMAAGTNYAVSFIALQHLHLALATKQPSVTAATFAGIVRTTQGQARLEKLTEFIRRITRSQLASAVGNLLAVCLGCIGLAKLWTLVFERPYLASHNAMYVYRSLDFLGSGTMIYAALTGVILWVSALAGGWFENFATFNRIPEAIAEHPIGRKVGRERMKRLASTVQSNLSGWTTSIVLGYLFGFVPDLGKFFGIPIDIRHVTLTTGTLALAAASFGKDWFYRGWFIYTAVGVAFTFALNLGVSFSIAATVAMKAYGVPRHDQLELIRHVAASFLRSPGSFIIPTAKSWIKDERQDRANADDPKDHPVG